MWLSPQEIRLHPAPHTRTPIRSYTLAIAGALRIDWFHDAHGSRVARATFGDITRELAIDVELVAELVSFNPFEFLLAESAVAFPFAYTDDERIALAPCLAQAPPGPRLAQWEDGLRRDVVASVDRTVDALVALNHAAADAIRYVRRSEPGIQSCEETLRAGSGSCRDSSWLLVQVLRDLGIAARFASGYLIQPPSASDPPSGRAFSVELHAWCEAYLPGAGWIGLDPTSGLLTTEGHIPLACAAMPSATAPVQGFAGPAESTLAVEMDVEEIAAAGPGVSSVPVGTQ